MSKDNRSAYDSFRVGMPMLRTTSFHIQRRRKRMRMLKQTRFHIIIRMAHELKSGYIPIYLKSILKAKTNE